MSDRSLSRVRVKVPGKLMLAGEYSVLKGGRALATTVDRYMAFQVQPQSERITVTSTAWEKPKTVSRKATGHHKEPLLDTVQYAIKTYKIATGVKVEVESDFKTSYGIGSSSAIRLGALLGLKHLHRRVPIATSDILAEDWETAKAAYTLQKRSQKLASGYDVATQIRGGLIALDPGDSDEEHWPGSLTEYPKRYQSNLKSLVHVFVNEVGAETARVLPDTLRWLEKERRLASLRATSEALIDDLVRCLDDPQALYHMRTLCRTVGRHRGLLRDSPHFPRELLEMESLPGCDESWSFKTTGAGGQDAILLIGPREHVIGKPASFLIKRGWQHFDVPFSNTGTKLQHFGDD